MNNYKRLCHCVCSTGSGRERSCEEQNIKKRKKVSFTGGPVSKNKRPRLQSPKLDVEAKDDSEEPPVVQKTPRAKEFTIQSVTGITILLSTGS